MRRVVYVYCPVFALEFCFEEVVVVDVLCEDVRVAMLGQRPVKRHFRILVLRSIFDLYDCNEDDC